MWMVGEGELQNKIAGQIHDQGLEGSVELLGHRADIAELMQAMDLFLLHSHFEGLPVSGVEAQAAGLPVLFSDRVTRQAGLTERVRFLPIDGASVEKWGQAAQAVAEGPGWDRNRGWKQVRQAGFDIQDTVQAFLALYGEPGTLGKAGGET